MKWLVTVLMAASLFGCGSKWVGKQVRPLAVSRIASDLPCELVCFSKYCTFRYVLSKNHGEYVINGKIEWTWDKKCHGVQDTKLIFLLVKDGIVVDTLPATISGRSTDRLTYHRKFSTDLEFDSVIVGEWNFKYRIG